MAGPSLINRVTNANVYLNGTTNLLGRAEEIELPQIKLVMVEHKGLGLFGKLKYPAGHDVLEAKVKWASFYPEVMGAVFQPFKSTALMVRADVQQMGADGLVSEVPLVALLTGIFHEMIGGKLVKHENSDTPSAMTVYYYKLMLEGIDQVEVAPAAGIFKVNGVDQLGEFNANQGS
jgi:P2 family phage contractile tail tube protein